MPFIRPSIIDITTRIEKGIESRLFGGVALLRRAVLRILARVFAGAIHTNYGHVDWLKDQLFVVTAEEEFLVRIGKAWGVNRRAGSFATGQVTFTGTNGSIIPADTRIQDENGIEYGTLAQVIIPPAGYTVGNIQSVEATADANNLYEGTTRYLQLIEPITGVNNSASIIGDITGGEDQEDIEDWRARILQRIQNPPMGGNAQDYVRWAMEISGVGRAWCYPLAGGPGTVSVVIISNDPNDPTPSTQLISDVQAHINDVKPVTADVTVVPPTDRWGATGYTEIYITTKISPNTLDLREAILANMRALFAPHKPGDDVKISQIRSAISTSGVENYEILGIWVDTIPEDKDLDLPFTGYMYPRLDNISFTSF